MAAPFQNYSGGVLLADIVKRNNLSTYVSEAIKERSMLLKSGAVVRNALLDAREGGTRIQVPEFNPVAPTEEIFDGTATWGTSGAGYLTPQRSAPEPRLHPSFTVALPTPWMTLQSWQLVKIRCFTSAISWLMPLTS